VLQSPIGNLSRDRQDRDEIPRRVAEPIEMETRPKQVGRGVHGSLLVREEARKRIEWPDWIDGHLGLFVVLDVLEHTSKPSDAKTRLECESVSSCSGYRGMYVYYTLCSVCGVALTTTKYICKASMCHTRR